MRVERSFDPKKEFYAKRTFKMQGRDFKRGDKFPSRDMSNKTLLKLFQNGFIGYAEDFRDNKTSIKEVNIESEPESEVTTEQPVQEETVKPKTTRRGRRKKTEES